MARLLVIDDDPTLLEVLQADPQFSTLVEILIAAGIDDSFTLPDQHTVFAPTNDAIAAALTADEIEALTTNPHLLSILAVHVVEDRFLLSQLVPGVELRTLYDETVLLPVAVDGDTVTVADAPIVVSDLVAINGVVHGIGTLLTPPPATLGS